MLTKSEVSACNVLGVEPYAPFDEVKRAYHALVKECHPDLHPDDEAAEALFKRVQAAYETLDAAHREGRDAKPNAQYNPFGGGYTGGAQQGAYTGAQQGAYTGAQQSPYGGGYAAGAQQGAYTGAQRPYGQAGAYGAGSQAQSGSYTQPGSGAGGYTGGAQQPPLAAGMPQVRSKAPIPAHSAGTRKTPQEAPQAETTANGSRTTPCIRRSARQSGSRPKPTTTGRRINTKPLPAAARSRITNLRNGTTRNTACLRTVCLCAATAASLSDAGDPAFITGGASFP